MAIERKTCREAFTRIDLIFVLVVGVILVLLLAGYLTRPKKRIRIPPIVQELTGAAQSYQKDTYYYPGIRYEKLSELYL